jgi:hypothetical protein
VLIHVFPPDDWETLLATTLLRRKRGEQQRNDSRASVHSTRPKSRAAPAARASPAVVDRAWRAVVQAIQHGAALEPMTLPMVPISATVGELVDVQRYSNGRSDGALSTAGLSYRLPLGRRLRDQG